MKRYRPDAIDTRYVYWTYAALAGASGVVLLGWAQVWFGPQTELVRFLGAIVIAFGCAAAALAISDGPRSSRRTLFWFAGGHLIVYVTAMIQWDPLLLRGPADYAVSAVFAVGVLLLYSAITVEGEATQPNRSAISLFGGPVPGSSEWLRSQYERQIHQAASQEERNRLARDLHDSVKQQLFVIQTAAATAQTRFDDDPSGARVALEQVRDSSREATVEMEAMLDQLRAAPLENIGLVEALKKQCEAFGFRTGARVDFQLGDLPPSATLAPGAQEALSNIARHARASNVWVRLDRLHDQVYLRIRDDGSGFDTNGGSRGMGLANMRVRAEEFGGRFNLKSEPGGTDLTLSIPCVPDSVDECRKRVLTAGAFLIVFVLLALWRQSVNELGFALFFAVMFARRALAYQRVRKQSEAAL